LFCPAPGTPFVTRGEERSRWKIHADRIVDQNPHIRLSIASVELPDGTRFDQYVAHLSRCAEGVSAPDPNETEAIRWIPLAEIPGLIADGLIVGAATIIGVQHVLLTAGQRAR